VKLQLRLAQKRGHFDAVQRDQLHELQADRDRLAEELAELKGRFAAREEMQGELDELRSLLHAREPEAEAPTGESDAALDAVITQLEQLDRDMHAVKRSAVNSPPSSRESA